MYVHIHVFCALSVLYIIYEAGQNVSDNSLLMKDVFLLV
jgi:hypothetical protein